MDCATRAVKAARRARTIIAKAASQPAVDLDSDSDLDQEFIDELNLVVNLLKDKAGWEMFACSASSNPLVAEMTAASDFDYSPDQVAAFVLWRMMSCWIDDAGEVTSELAGKTSDDDDEFGAYFISSLRTWKENDLMDILQSDRFLGFEYLSEMFDNYAARSRDELEAAEAELRELYAAEASSSQIRPLSESEVPPILRSNSEQGSW